jgi:malonyl CoA-acyl carrier protein transacylase
LTALCAAGWIDENTLMELSIARGHLMAAAGANHNTAGGAMLAVKMPLNQLEALVENSSQNVIIANRNSPNQGVLSGATSALADIEKICREKGIGAIRLPVSTAFHSELVEDAARPFLAALNQVPINPTAIQVFANTSGEAYPTDPLKIRQLLGNQLARPVDFVGEVENLYHSGVRTFVEIGPKSVLTGLISDILQDRNFAAMSLDASIGKGNGVADLARLLCQLASIGYPLALTEWEKPLSSVRKSRMNVLLSGTNYRVPKTDRNDRMLQDGSQATKASKGGFRPAGDGGTYAPEGRPQAEGGISKDSGQRVESNSRNPSPTNDPNQRTHQRHPMNFRDTTISKNLPVSDQPPTSRQLDSTNPSHNNKIIMNKNDINQSKLIQDALKVVNQGLQSMQNLHSETARAHQKFLESQTEANRTLQEMMKSTQRLTEKSMGISIEPLKPSASPQYRLEPTDDSRQTELEQHESDITAAEAEPSIGPAFVGHSSTTRQSIPSPAHPELHQGAANGYASISAETDSRSKEVTSTHPDRKKIETAMLAVVSRLTGYPAEMLGLDMDIEAELGIDSIKRVEILSALEEQMPDLPTVSPETMGSLKTLGQIAEYFIEPDGEAVVQPSADEISQAQHRLIEAKISKPAENSKNHIVTNMLAVVSRLTGYPAEMLGLDMDIEAELGIDSIKRVEILSALEEKMPDLPTVSPEIMGTLKTLGQISEYLASAVKPGTLPKPSDGVQVEITSTATEISPGGPDPSERTLTKPELLKIPRKVVKVVNAPELSGSGTQIPSNKVVLVTEDHTSLSDNIAQELTNLGISTKKINLSKLKPNHRFPETAGLIIVQDPASDNMEQDLKVAFALTKDLAPNLLDDANDGQAVFATISRMDGAFGFNRKAAIHPVQGGLAGLAKTAAIEWENVCCHAIDIAADCPNSPKTASAVVREILTPGPVEIGLGSDSRCTLALEAEPYPSGQINLDSNDVVIISGGARGVTAATALSLAKHTNLRLFLLGRSPNPVPEPVWLSSLEDETSIKKAILENEFKDTLSSPVELEKAYKSYMANREINRNLAALKTAGSAVHYYSVDIRDFEAINAIIEAIRLDHGPVAGIIHGAGVLEDRLIRDKTADQFERVFDTKVRGLKNLIKATHHDPLKYLVVFSSIAARFGNKGQVDYAMANEALNKISQAESFRRDKCRVIAVNWGPWDGGMVTPGLKRQFEHQGIDLIPIEKGAECLIHEMKTGTDAAVEVIIGAEMADRKTLKKPSLVTSPPAVNKPQFTLCFERQIDVAQYPVLNSHIIDEKPVVPLALMMEWFAHGALHPNPGLMLHGLDDIRVLKGIRLEREKHEIRLFADRLKKNGEFYEVAVELRGGNETRQDSIHARARAILSEQLVPAPPYQFSKAMIAGAYSKNIQEIYDEILFHGHQLRGIRKIISCSPRGMVAQISSAPEPREWISSPFRDRWIADPLALDCAFQMAILWCFEEKQTLSLPSYATSYRQYCRLFPAEGITAILEVSEVSDHKMRGDFTFTDSEGEVVACLKGYQATSDATLFRSFKPQYSALARGPEQESVGNYR